MSMPMASILSFAGVERFLDELEDFLLTGRLVVFFGLAGPRLAFGERKPEMAAGHFVERFFQERRVLRFFGELAVEGCARRKLDRQRVAGKAGWVRLAQNRRRGNRPLLHPREDRS